MKFILDTDILIYFLKGNKNVTNKIANHSEADLATTIVTHTELLFGAFYSEHKKKNLTLVESLLNNIQIVPFCTESSYIFAQQKAHLKKQGNIIADLDLMIASIAIKHQRILVTNNSKHFSRINNLKLENWYD